MRFLKFKTNNQFNRQKLMRLNTLKLFMSNKQWKPFTQLLNITNPLMSKLKSLKQSQYMLHLNLLLNLLRKIIKTKPMLCTPLNLLLRNKQLPRLKKPRRLSQLKMMNFLTLMKQRNRSLFLKKLKCNTLKSLIQSFLAKILSRKPRCIMLSITRSTIFILLKGIRSLNLKQQLIKQTCKISKRFKKKQQSSYIPLLKKCLLLIMRPNTKPNLSILRSNISQYQLRRNIKKRKKTQLFQSFNRRITRRLSLNPQPSLNTRSTLNFLNNPMRLLLNIKKNPLKHTSNQMKSSTFNLRSCTEPSITQIQEVWI